MTACSAPTEETTASPSPSVDPSPAVSETVNPSGQPETTKTPDPDAAASSTPAGNPTSSTTNNSNKGSSSSSSNKNNSSSSSSNTNKNNSSSGSNSSSSGSNTSTKPAATPQPTPAPTPKPVHVHNWVYHKATGHTETVTEAWDEPVYTTIYEYHTICNGCGKDFGPGEAGVEAAGHHILAVFGDACESYHDEKVAAGEEITDYIHHDAVTKWVEDSPAYYQCSGCGAKKDG